eukprot:scaffold119599_cov69-Phaeocystis_antarctica.AAC.1
MADAPMYSTTVLPTATHGGWWPQLALSLARPSRLVLSSPPKTARNTNPKNETPPVPARKSRALHGERRPPYKSHARSPMPACLPLQRCSMLGVGDLCGSTSSSSPRPWRSCSPGRGATAPRTGCPGSRSR